MPLLRRSLPSPVRFAPLALSALFACVAPGVEDEPDAPDEPLATTSSPLVAADPVSRAVTESCTTASVRALAVQLVEEIECIRPGAFERIDQKPGISLGTAAAGVPYLQTPAARALVVAQKARGVTMKINSGLRTLPQQYLLHRWYQTGRCGIGLAASPGTSNHESAVAVDIEDNAGWRASLQGNGFRWLGASDPVHYDFIGGGAVNLRGLSVRAFQRLWNRNHPEDPIDVDGAFGPETSARLAKAPVGGFPMGAPASCKDADAGVEVDPDPIEPADVPPTPDATEEPAEDDAETDDGRIGPRRGPPDASAGCNAAPTQNELGSLTVAALALTLAFAAVARRELRRQRRGGRRAGRATRSVRAHPRRPAPLSSPMR